MQVWPVGDRRSDTGGARIDGMVVRVWTGMKHGAAEGPTDIMALTVRS